MNRAKRRFSVKELILALFLCGTFAQSELALPDDAREKLAAARRMARISEASREVIEDQLEALEAGENATPEKIARYQDYLKRVQEFERQQREILDEMEALYEPFSENKESLTNSTSRGSDVVTVTIPRDDASDRLQREFKESLESFDGELLSKLDELAEEMEELEEDAASESSELAAAIEAAQQRLEQADAQAQEGGGGMESQSAEGSGSGSDGGPDQAQPGDPGTEGGGDMAAERVGEGMEEELSGDGSSFGDPAEGSMREGEEMGSSISRNGDEQSAPAAGEAGRAELPEGSNGAPPEDPVMSSHDDDIISRQLREAAEKETDPELKAKLWAEYKRYKESSTR
jgi:hypothetical protein